ncbi:aldose 1-epimerase [Microbacterium sp. RD1]|uniref:aldose 1-epimerase n=1 Tax=Microbacterium sp. RD1 TaxID=3457313 RepID=UPI003FA5F7E1
MSGDQIALVSADGETSATFIPESNLVCSTLRHEGADWLDPVRAAEALVTGKDYGISLVHPWAGRLARWGYTAGREVVLSEDDPQIPHDKWDRPIHGVWDRLLRWTVDSTSISRLEASLAWDDEHLLSVFPYPHRLSVVAEVFGGGLRIETRLRPTSDVPVPVTFGYHAFLRIPDSSRETWTLLLDASERLLLDDDLIPNGRSERLVESTYALGERDVDDDIGGLAAPAVLAVSDGDRRVSVDLEAGFSVAHVWAPAGRNLVSFEPMTAPANALNSGEGLRMVEPGGTFTSGVVVRLS